jgi:hypothetical protein
MYQVLLVHALFVQMEHLILLMVINHQALVYNHVVVIVLLVVDQPQLALNVMLISNLIQ